MMNSMRIGQGYDVHPLISDRPLVLGGVTIPFEAGLQGHSDADVLLHAITDALLGAAALGDIGTWFPDHDARHKNADSRILLSGAYAAVQSAGWSVVNIDSTIIAERPKLRPYLDQMRSNIASDLGLLPATVSIKAKTNERLGYLGRQEAIAAEAVILLTSV